MPLSGSTLLQRYNKYWSLNHHLPRLEFNAPCCGQMLKTRRPDEGEKWDTMMQCPHCDELFHLTSTSDSVALIYVVPEARKQ